MISIVENIDCMIGMAKYPDKFFDLAIVDPPYGLNITNIWPKSPEFGYKQYKNNGWDKNIPSDEYFIELKRVSKHQVIWGGNYFNLGPSPCYLIWDKGQRDFTMSDAELAWCSFKKTIRVFDLSRAVANQEARNHPTQKPIKLYKWILHNYAKVGDKILDTHLGSGSSRIAAHSMGFDFYGFEIDKEYFDAQEKRFRNSIMQLTLF